MVLFARCESNEWIPFSATKVIWWRRNLVWQHGCRREHSRQEDESHLTPRGVVNNIHKSFNQTDDQNYTRQKWTWSAIHHVGKRTQKRKQRKNLQQNRCKHKNKHGGQPYGCNWQQQKQCRGFWSRRKWSKWGTWTANKFPRRIHFTRFERSNSQPLKPKYKAV